MLLFSTCARITVVFPLPQGPATPILATTMVSASWSQTGAMSSLTTSASALRGTMGCTARTVSTAGGAGEDCPLRAWGRLGWQLGGVCSWDCVGHQGVSSFGACRVRARTMVWVQVRSEPCSASLEGLGASSNNSRGASRLSLIHTGSQHWCDCVSWCTCMAAFSGDMV